MISTETSTVLISDVESTDGTFITICNELFGSELFSATVIKLQEVFIAVCVDMCEKDINQENVKQQLLQLCTSCCTHNFTYANQMNSSELFVFCYDVPVVWSLHIYARVCSGGNMQYGYNLKEGPFKLQRGECIELFSNL